MSYVSSGEWYEVCRVRINISAVKKHETKEKNTAIKTLQYDLVFPPIEVQTCAR
jgi:hypothetical protein